MPVSSVPRPSAAVWLPHAPLAAIVIAIWTAIYLWRSLAGFYSLNTNAFDLSVFDYAIASLARGEHGYVPFMGQSIFSHHTMPILAALVPVRLLFQSPAALLVVQILAIAAAALLYARFTARLALAPAVSAALVFMFLFARRTHAAMASMFYPESFQTPLVLALVLAWTARASRAYWLVLALLLSTKEDAGLYAAAFGALQAVLARDRRRQALLTIGVSLAWMALAVVVLIPQARAGDGLPAANPLFESRFGVAGGAIDVSVLADRLLSPGTVERAASLVSSAGFLPLAAPVWLVPAVPGAVISMAADPATMQADLTNHYVWPVLPWLALAAAAGWQRISARWPRTALGWLIAVVAFTAADNPALQRLHRTRVDADAVRVRAQLQSVGATVTLAQPNLIPHLAHQSAIYAVGGDLKPPTLPDLVLLTEVGNLWPMSLADVRGLIGTYDRDPRYERVTPGPLHAFRRRPGAK